MIALGNRRLWLCGEPVDMRKGIDGLVAVVVQRLQREVMTGDVFVFIGRDPSRLKMLCWDHDGYWLVMKRLAAGRFVVPRAIRLDGQPASIELTMSEWQLILDGIIVRDRVILRRHTGP